MNSKVLFRCFGIQFSPCGVSGFFRFSCVQSPTPSNTLFGICVVDVKNFPRKQNTFRRSIRTRSPHTQHLCRNPRFSQDVTLPVTAPEFFMMPHNTWQKVPKRCVFKEEAPISSPSNFKRQRQVVVVGWGRGGVASFLDSSARRGPTFFFFSLSPLCAAMAAFTGRVLTKPAQR